MFDRRCDVRFYFSMDSAKPYIIFDLDGTIIDSLDGIQQSVDFVLQEQGLARNPLDMRGRIGPPIERIFESVFRDLGRQKLAHVVEGFRNHYDSVGFLGSRLFPGISELVSRLAAMGVRMFVLTNKKAAVASRILEHLGILHFFLSVNSPANLTPPALNKKEAAVRLFGDLQARPSGVFVIGDGWDDFEMAAAYEYRFLLACYGYGYTEVITKAPHVQQVFNPLEILEIITT
jgi:phosphoglycolate phosphatase